MSINLGYVVSALIGAGLVFVITYVIAKVKSSFIKIDDKFDKLDTDLMNKFNYHQTDFLDYCSRIESNNKEFKDIILSEIDRLNSKVDSVYDKHLHKYHSDKLIESDK